MKSILNSFAPALIALLAACAPAAKKAPVVAACDVELVVLGVAQDGGKPQIGNPADPAWADPALRRSATSLALIDRRGGKPQRFLFEATPDIKAQLHALDAIAPVEKPVALDGVFLTHAHIGHYVGLMFLGHEASGARHVPAYVMPRMAHFLEANGPWSQLVRFENIILAIMADGAPETLGENLMVTPFAVPHRQEFSEVVGFRIDGPSKSAIFLPDIDSWEDWDADGTRIEDMIASVDIAYLDATFYANGEIPGRDMSGFPHPFVTHSMQRFAALPPPEKAKVRFIHMNHTNPLHDPRAPERRAVADAGFSLAEEGERICL
jgi:pyrroloquinoline quinone biosynthesis protein B